MIDEVIYFRGKLLGEEQSRLPLRSLFYGEGVFETFRYRYALPRYMAAHLDRMHKGARLLGIPFPSKDEFYEHLERALAASGFGDAYMKLCLLSSGDTVFHHLPARGEIMVVTRPYVAYPKSSLRTMVSSIRRNSTSPVAGLKSLNYLDSVLARREAMARGFDEALFLNEKGHLAEGSSTNVFWFDREGTLNTPAERVGLVPGVSRGVVLDCARELGLGVREGEFSLTDIKEAYAGFLTNSIMGVVPMSEIDGVALDTQYELVFRVRKLFLSKLGWE